MMDLPNLVVLDVGHGNCSVLMDTGGITIFDGGLGDVLLEFLETNNITDIASVLISHTHEDHIAGLITVLLAPNINVTNVYVNPDPNPTDIWKEFRSAIKHARTNKGTIPNTQLNTSLTGQLDHGSVHIEILSPVPETAMSGVTGQDLNDKQITRHAMSAVVRLKKDDVPLVLLSGDLDSRGLEYMLKDMIDARAKVLIFPHHGGKPSSGDVSKFTQQLCELTHSDIFIFSIGRGTHGTPQFAVVEKVREIQPQARILCTQLSEHCTSKLPKHQSDHLNDLPAAGDYSNSCCAGSIVVDMSKSNIVILPSEEAHTDFIQGAASTPLCLSD